mmetsp:Transcript_3608/g.7501  ORF Transcript_3608/g.7501 Transcript_3608/m.7501 type:complete len:350 (+) Transcript_3608:522-1571(+)
MRPPSRRVTPPASGGPASINPAACGLTLPFPLLRVQPLGERHVPSLLELVDGSHKRTPRQCHANRVELQCTALATSNGGAVGRTALPRLWTAGTNEPKAVERRGAVSRSLWVRVLVLEARLRHDIKWLLLATTAAAATPVLHRLLGQRRGIVLFGRHIVRQEQRPRLAGIETKLKHTLFVVAAVRWVRYQNVELGHVALFDVLPKVDILIAYVLEAKRRHSLHHGSLAVEGVVDSQVAGGLAELSGHSLQHRLEVPVRHERRLKVVAILGLERMTLAYPSRASCDGRGRGVRFGGARPFLANARPRRRGDVGDSHGASRGRAVDRGGGDGGGVLWRSFPPALLVRFLFA